jgi:hypothetical protein
MSQKSIKTPKISSKKSDSKMNKEIIPEVIPEITPQVEDLEQIDKMVDEILKPKVKESGVVAKIETLIIEILKETPLSSKDLKEKCPPEFNAATWLTRIYRLKSVGSISYDPGTKLFRVGA